VGWVVNSIFIQDEGVGQRTDFQQPMPVHPVARQARHFQSENNPGTSHPHFTHQLLKPFPIHRRRPRPAEVTVDDMDPFQGPAQSDGAFPQRVLPLGALDILDDLPDR